MLIPCSVDLKPDMDANLHTLTTRKSTDMEPITAPDEFVPRLYPPFPPEVNPCIELETISLRKLRDNEDQECEKLFQICQTKGFFYLEYTGTDCETLPQVAKDVGYLAEKVFMLPLEDKQTVVHQKPYSLLGYKRVGKTKTDENGTPDTAEFMNIGKDDILQTSSRQRVDPPRLVLEPENQSVLQTFVCTSHSLGLQIMDVLAAKLGIDKDEFRSRHDIDQPCDSHCRMIRGPPRKRTDQPEIQTPGHTDFGTITILFNWLGGLQVWSEPSRGNFMKQFEGDQPLNKEEGQWLWVKPKPGCAIINLGDAAVKFSGGILCSARHRVVPAPGAQGLWPRYSIVYFVRPNDEVYLQRLVGGIIPAALAGEEGDILTSAQHQERKYRAMGQDVQAVSPKEIAQD